MKADLEKEGSLQKTQIIVKELNNYDSMSNYDDDYDQKILEYNKKR